MGLPAAAGMSSLSRYELIVNIAGPEKPEHLDRIIYLRAVETRLLHPLIAHGVQVAMYMNSDLPGFPKSLGP